LKRLFLVKLWAGYFLEETFSSEAIRATERIKTNFSGVNLGKIQGVRNEVYP